MISCEEDIFNEVCESFFDSCGLHELFYQDDFYHEEVMEIILDALRSYMVKNIKCSVRGKISINKEMSSYKFGQVTVSSEQFY